ncbi:Poly(U)-binding-splicing factor puf60 [Podila humilis]|nr:Poly(U)-binding-splicing factor puf60 [Podila humilis]
MDEEISLKRSNDEIKQESTVDVDMESITSEDGVTPKKAKVEQSEDDLTANIKLDVDGDHTEEAVKQEDESDKLQEDKDPETGLTLVRAGALTSATEPEPSLAITNIAEQQKAMHILCRVYVGSISFEATEDDVRKKLGRFGPIKELTLKVDPMSGKHRGFCFVEYDLPEAAIVAVQASDSVEVVGRHLKIGRPKNYDANAVNDLPTPPECRLFVANIGALVSETDLGGIFKAFGEVENCVLIPDPMTRQHKGYGYVQFKMGTNVDVVVESMKGFTLLDTPMGVCKAIIGGPIPEGMKALDSMAPSVPVPTPVSHISMPATTTTVNVSPAMIAKATATAASTAQRLVAMQHHSGGMVNDRESVASEENMSISGNQRYMVMQSLARSAGGSAAGLFPATTSTAGTGGGGASSASAVESTVVRLQYSATPADIDDQLEDEFKEECSRYGPVVRVHMMPLANGILRIFIQFGSPIDARSAAAQLNGRQFDGKTIAASLFDQQEFAAGHLA